MLPKQYSPIRICNPNEGHVVPLMPTQGFSIVLTGEADITFDSPYFMLTDTVYGDGKVTFNFSQTYDLKFWSKVSKTFLGEIITLSAGGAGSVCVFLTGARSNQVTIINPNSNCLKVDAGSILEIVLYDEYFSGSWDCTIISGHAGLKYEQVEYKKVDTSTVSTWGNHTDFYYAFPRGTAIGDPPCREHHYWFRFDYASVIATNYLSGGVYPAGKIVFDSGVNDVFRLVSPQINVREKHRNKLFNLSNSVSDQTILLPVTKHERIVQRYISPQRDSMFRQEITLRKKADEELHSHKVMYF